MEIALTDITSESDNSMLAKTCQFEITYGRDNKIKSGFKETTLLDIDNAELLLRWYIEDFVTKFPLEVPKARMASMKLKSYASLLLRSLKLPSILPSRGMISHLVIHVNSSTESGVFGQLRWEVLENLELLQDVLADEAPGIVSISILRLATSIQIPHSFQDMDSVSETVDNILALTARPDEDADIPHRLITRSVHHLVEQINAANRLTGSDTTKVSFEICRPGTFKALEQHLSQRPYGYYKSVHLDVHGESQGSAEAWAIFVRKVGEEKSFPHFDIGSINQSSSSRNSPVRNRVDIDRVPASELAKSLTRHGVRLVVLNACRSATGGNGLQANLAHTLVRHGIRTTIAMAFKALDESAGLFMSVLYQQLIVCGLSPLAAVHAARQYMISDQVRETRYLTKVHVDDFIVPIIYQSSHYHDPRPQYDQEAARAESCQAARYFRMAPQIEKVRGLEGDMLVLENHLLLNSDKIWVEGPPGIGKTAFIQQAASWWSATGLIDKYFVLDVSAIPNSQTLLEQTGKRVKYNSCCLVVVDGLESTSGSVFLEDLRKFLRELNVKNLKKKKKLPDSRTPSSFVIVNTRKKPQHERLERMITVTHVMRMLRPEDALELSSSLLELAQRMPQAMEKEELAAVKQFGSLVQMNPLALKLLIHAFCRQSLGPQAFIASLLQGRGIDIDDEWLDKTADTHFIRETRRRLKDHHLALTLFLPIWDLATIDDLKYYLTFAQMNQRRTDKLSPRSRYYRTMRGMFKDLTFQDLDLLFDPSKKLPHFDQMELTELLRVFSDQLLLATEPCTDLGDYMRLHPVLPLLVRDMGNGKPFEKAQTTCRTVLPLYFRYRTKSWPFRQLYFKECWKGPRQTAAKEFYNFLAATYHTLHLEPTTVNRILLLFSAVSTQKGIGEDMNRHSLLAHFWKQAVSQLEATSESLKTKAKARPPIVPVNDGLSRLFGLFYDVRYVLEPWTETMYKSAGFMNDITLCLFLMAISDYYTWRDERKATEYLHHAVAAYNTRTKIPFLDIFSRFLLGSTIKFVASATVRGRQFTPIESLDEGQLRAKISNREDRYSMYKFFGSDVEGYDDGKEVSMRGVLGHGNSLTGSRENVLMAVLEARQIMKSGDRDRTEKARKVLTDLLKAEIRYSQDWVSLVSLHKALCKEVEMESGCWERAKYHLDEAKRIEAEESPMGPS